MDAIKNLLTRNASSKLTMPMPSSEQMQIIYQAALRSPDHAWLRPSSFIEVSGKGLEKLSKIFEKYAREKLFMKKDNEEVFLIEYDTISD